MSALLAAENRRAAEKHLRAAIAHPTQLADPACYAAAMETALGLWPFADLDADVRYAHLKALGNVRREGGSL